MAVQAVTEPTGKKIGSTTVGATAGTGLAGAAAVVLVWVLGEVGVDVPTEVAAALAVLIGGIGTLVGGKLTPSNQHTERIVPVDLGVTSQVTPASIPVIPDGVGQHRADVEGPTVDDEGYLVVDDGPAPAGSDSDLRG